jgi:beta-aspartyl-peptidase (threonine type)
LPGGVPALILNRGVRRSFRRGVDYEEAPMLHGLVVSLLVVMAVASIVSAAPPAPRVVLAIHGGTAGERTELTPDLEKVIRADMRRALETGYAVLQKPDGSALDAVEAAVRVLEDSPHFNAGKGSVFTHEGRNEMDASIMDGSNLQAGAVASVTVIKNPITAARAVMEKTKHVLLMGRGAEVFAAKAGIETVDPAYFWTERRWQQIKQVWEREAGERASDKNERANDNKQSRAGGGPVDDEPWGTVGAVALDAKGNLAAATSTGGRTNKMYGRVGDSPIVGAGTYAENGVCAVSGTGEGEFFIRYAACHDIAALMKYKGLSLEAATSEVIQNKLKPAGGEGGVVSIDASGNFAAPYNTPGLYRGYVTTAGEIHVMLYED